MTNIRRCTEGRAFPSPYPIDINENLWLYENYGSLSVVDIKATGHVRVPMKTLCVIVDRYRKYLAKRRRK